jgi:hypothetical protein
LVWIKLLSSLRRGVYGIRGGLDNKGAGRLASHYEASPSHQRGALLLSNKGDRL